MSTIGLIVLAFSTLAIYALVEHARRVSATDKADKLTVDKNILASTLQANSATATRLQTLGELQRTEEEHVKDHISSRSDFDNDWV